MSEPVRYQVRHQTVYAYGSDVAHAHHLLHLAPRTTETQTCEEFALELLPQPATRGTHVDAFGNSVTSLELDRPHDRLQVTARTLVQVRPRERPDPAASRPWEQVAEGLAYAPRPIEPTWLEAARFRTQSPYVPIKSIIAKYAAPCFSPGAPLLSAAAALMQKIFSEFTYSPGETQIGTPLLEVLAKRRGVCQDYAHLMIACLRAHGLAARYVSGYLRTQPAAGQGGLVGADASHAWVAVFAPPFGWVELDPTNNLWVAQDHVLLAWGRDFGDVSPLRGVILGGGAHTLEVAVEVRPVGP